MFKKGQKAWNKGIDHLSDEAKKRIGNAIKKRIKENGHPRGMLGKHHNKETITRLKLIKPSAELIAIRTRHKEKHGMWTGNRKKIQCPICRNTFEIPPNEYRKYCSLNCKYIGVKKNYPKCKICKKILGGMKRKFCNDCKGIYYSGKRSSFWKGGITKIQKLVRGTKLYSNWRTSCFKRDGYQCIIGGEEHGTKLHVDHYPIGFSEILRRYKVKNMDQAKRVKVLWDLRNGRTLCIDCHKKTDNFGNRKTKKQTFKI